VTQTLFVPEDHVLPVVPVLQVILLVQKDPERQRIPEIRWLPLGLEDLLALKTITVCGVGMYKTEAIQNLTYDGPITV